MTTSISPRPSNPVALTTPSAIPPRGSDPRLAFSGPSRLGQGHGSTWGLLLAVTLVPSTGLAADLELDALSSVSEFGVNAVDVQGNRAYTVGGKLHVLDVTDPTQPRDLGEAGFGTFTGADIQVVGQYAFVAANGAGLLVFDVSDPAALARVATVPVGNANTVHVVGTLACVAASADGVQVVDVSNPHFPVRKGGYKVQASSSPGNGATWAGDRIYAASGRSGLALLDAANPSAPGLVWLHSTAKPALDVQVQGSLAYVAMADTGLAVIDVSKPGSPVTVGFGAAPDARRVELAGGFAYVADGTFGMRVFDVSNPASLREVAHVTPGAQVLDVRVDQDLVYVANFNAGLRVLQIVSPPVVTAHPVDQKVVEGSSATFEVQVTGWPAPSLRWQVSADQGQSWRDLADDANLQGAATGRLTIGAASTAWSGLQFRAMASNKKGSVTSFPGTLSVDPLPTEPVVELGPLRMFAGFTVRGEVGATYRIESTEGLGSADWRIADTVTLRQETELWIDRSGPMGGSRFYRAVKVP